MIDRTNTRRSIAVLLTVYGQAHARSGQYQGTQNVTPALNTRQPNDKYLHPNRSKPGNRQVRSNVWTRSVSVLGQVPLPHKNSGSGTYRKGARVVALETMLNANHRAESSGRARICNEQPIRMSATI